MNTREELERVIQEFNEPIPPSFYDYVDYLVRAGQLEFSRFKLPEPSDKQYEKLSKVHVVCTARSHYEKVAPQICYALHKRGYKYSQIFSEQRFRGTVPDILAVPCTKWRECGKEVSCKDCDEGNGLGFTIVEIGTVTCPGKIFATAEGSFDDVNEFWLCPLDGYMYVFIAKRILIPYKSWEAKKGKKVIYNE